MAVKVNASFDNTVVLDNGDKWETVETAVGPRLDVFKSGNPNATPPTVDKLIACFAPGRWESANLVAKEDKAALLTEATELIKDVDDGNFGHQSTEWQDRAEKFLADVA